MTAIANARPTEFGPPSPAVGTAPSAADQLFYKNTLVSRDAEGRAVVPSDGDGFNAYGVARALFDNRTDSEAGGDDDDLDVDFLYGVFAFDIDGDDPLPQDTVYVVDNQTVSVDNSGGSGLRGVAGIVSEVRAVNGRNQAFVHITPAVVALAAAVEALKYSA